MDVVRIWGNAITIKGTQLMGALGSIDGPDDPQRLDPDQLRPPAAGRRGTFPGDPAGLARGRCEQIRLAERGRSQRELR
jgi:hypothetical protein